MASKSILRDILFATELGTWNQHKAAGTLERISSFTFASPRNERTEESTLVGELARKDMGVVTREDGQIGHAVPGTSVVLTSGSPKASGTGDVGAPVHSTAFLMREGKQVSRKFHINHRPELAALLGKPDQADPFGPRIPPLPGL